MRIGFDIVGTRRQKSGPCPVCGKRTTRSMQFEQTVNPWNKDASGAIKTYEQVRADVQAEADSWEPDFTHDKCRTEAHS